MATPTLQDFLSEAQNLLHDSQGAYWSTTELQGYCNKGMQRVALDTGCLRQDQSLTLTAGTGTYNLSALNNPAVFDVIAIWLLYGAQRIALRRLAFSSLVTFYQPWTNYQAVPLAFAFNGPTDVVVGPLPGTNYDTTWNCCLVPSALVAPTDACPFPYPFTEAVPYYAAYLAKIAMQQKSEAQFFFDIYSQRILEASNAQQRQVPDLYGMDDIMGLP